jgi:hypothetical protein
MVPLAATVLIFHFALFQEPLVSLKSFAVDFLVALIAASFGYRLLRAGQMARQYGWLFRRRGLLSWRRIQKSA